LHQAVVHPDEDDNNHHQDYEKDNAHHERLLFSKPIRRINGTLAQQRRTRKPIGIAIAMPPGTYPIKAWHEKLGTATQTITVGANEAKEISFVFKAM
jgi:hypothetical protein